MSDDWITTTREASAVQVPYGTRVTLRAGTRVRVTQRLGSSITVESESGFLLRLDAGAADALGLPAATAGDATGTDFSEARVWEVLRSCYDPEIPVDIVELGLVYGCAVTEVAPGKRRVRVTMTLTAPGCGMGDILKQEIEERVGALPTVVEVEVELVLDPPWDPGRMSEAARLSLGLY
jgi:probable FeS assembly SUF system protein SufT